MIFVYEERQSSNQELITFGRGMGGTLMGGMERLIKSVKK
jgi:hypothetical protein